MPDDAAIFAPDPIPPAWSALAEMVIAPGNVLFLLGKVDAGKSTLARTLARESLRRGLVTGFLDSDVGQSVIGPPTTLGLKILRDSLNELKGLPDALYCIGDVTPRSQRSEAIVGVRRLADVARRRGCDVLIVDSTGFVQGPEAFTLKTLKIENLTPTHLIAVEESPTSVLLRPILATFEHRRDLRICRLYREAATQSRSQDTRRQYRESQFAAYFAGGSERVFSFDDVSLCGAALRWDDLPPDGFVDALVAFRDRGGLTAALGILRHLDAAGRAIRVFVPSLLPPDARTLQLFDAYRMPSTCCFVGSP